MDRKLKILFLGMTLFSLPGYSQAQAPEIEWAFVKGGTFMMGCTPEQGGDCRENEMPAHRVTVGDFYIGKYEVTQAQWIAVMGDNPSFYKGDDLPVETADWRDIYTFIERAYGLWKTAAHSAGMDDELFIERRLERFGEQANAQSGGFANYTDTTDNLNIEMIAVQGGTFMMGCTPEQGEECRENEIPARQVKVGDFYIGKYEVTKGQWWKVMSSDMDNNLIYNPFPLEIDWYNVQKFIQKLNDRTGKQYRLPTEAEWEFAARGGNSSRGFRYSGSDTIDSVAWYQYNSGSGTSPVGQKQPNELGIYDMSGNVWEWCSNWYVSDDSAAPTDPQGAPSKNASGIRGGGWNDDAGRVRIPYRITNDSPLFRYFPIGIRLACDME